MADLSIRIFHRISSFGRFMALRRQLAEVSRAMGELSVSDRRALAMHLAREMDVSVHQSREASTTNAAFTRVRSGNPRVRLLGLAQWLTSAFRETEESPYGEIQDAHRQIKRTMRVLRESAGVQSPQAA